MHFYEELVTQTQMNFSRYYGVYAAGRTPYELSDKPALPYARQIERLVREIREADCVVVAALPGFPPRRAAISTMRTTPPIANTSASTRGSTASTARLRA